MARKTKARGSKLVGTATRVTAAAKKRAEDLLALVQRRKLRITEDFFDMGLALKELRDRRLYVALGHTSFDAMLEARKVIGATQAFKLIKVVEAFPDRELALRVGVEKGFALVAYAAATPSDDVPRLLAQSGVRGRAIEALSAREIDKMTKQARARKKAARPPSAEEKRARKAARAWQARLRRDGLRGATVGVALSDGKAFLEARVPLESALRWLA